MATASATDLRKKVEVLKLRRDVEQAEQELAYLARVRPREQRKPLTDGFEKRLRSDLRKVQRDRAQLLKQRSKRFSEVLSGGVERGRKGRRKGERKTRIRRAVSQLEVVEALFGKPKRSVRCDESVCDEVAARYQLDSGALFSFASHKADLDENQYLKREELELAARSMLELNGESVQVTLKRASVDSVVHTPTAQQQLASTSFVLPVVDPPKEANAVDGESEEEDEGSDQADNGKGETTSGQALSVQSLVAQALVDESGRLEFGGAPDAEAVAESVRALELTGGPAEQPAIREVQTLRLALQPHWDKALSALGDREALIEAAFRQQISEVEYEQRDQAQGEGWAISSFREVNLFSDSDPRVIKALGKKMESDPLELGFAAYSGVNYGLLLTYRQTWTPQNYQVGDLITTIPLTPTEKRKYKVSRVLKSNRSTKDERSRRQEVETTSKFVSRFVENTLSNLSSDVSLGVDGNVSGNFGVVSFGVDSHKNFDTAESVRHQKDLMREEAREAVARYKRETAASVTTSSELSTTFEETGTISNPNDELTVTYLFYELQRAFRVNERLRSVRPVVLVPRRIPAPFEVDNYWILRHDWVIRRALLDDSFLAALDGLRAGWAPAQHLEVELNKNLAGLRKALESLQSRIGKEARVRDDLAEELITLDEDLAKSAETTGNDGFFQNIAEELFYDGEEGERRRIVAQRESKANLLAKAERRLDVLKQQLQPLSDSISEATERLLDAVLKNLDLEVELLRLRLHLRDNITHYMHAIWSSEHPDQRYFRLHDIEVDFAEPAQPIDGVPFAIVGFGAGTFILDGTINEPPPTVTRKRLAEIADIDQLLGVKGNFMIFPLTQDSAVAQEMMEAYVAEDGVTVTDPEWFTAEAVRLQFLRALAAQNSQNSEIKQLSVVSETNSEEVIVVPTGLPYVEALPGRHPLLEDFKLKHRLVDVEGARAKVFAQRLENLRVAARLLSEKYDDSTIDQRISIVGGPELVNEFETLGARNYCSSMSLLPRSIGGLIHASAGSGLTVGFPLTNRSGFAA